MKIFKICVDGIDKTGKDLLVPYINELTGYKYLVQPRGIISVMAYNELYGRCTYEENLKRYDLDSEINTLNVLLCVDENDWRIRCKATNEPQIDYKSNKEIFMKYHDEMYKHSFCLRFNTSIYTPYEIANEIAKWLKQYQGE